MAETAAGAVSATGAVVTLDVPGAAALTGAWGDPAGRCDHTLPVRLEGRVLGSIGVALPRGRTLGDADLRLLEAVAQQAAMAFRNTVLASQLAARVDELEHTTRQLTESRLRLVEADDAARRGLEDDDRPPGAAADRRPADPDRARSAPRSRPSEPEAGIDALVADTQRRAGGAARAEPGRVPAAARPGRLGADAALDARAADGASEPDRRRARRPTVLAAGGGCALLLLRRGHPRPDRAVGSLRLALDGPEVVLRIEEVDPHVLDLPTITDRLGRRWRERRVRRPGPAWSRSPPHPCSRRPSLASSHAAESRSGPRSALATYAAAALPSRSTWSTS